MFSTRPVACACTMLPKDKPHIGYTLLSQPVAFPCWAPLLGRLQADGEKQIASIRGALEISQKRDGQQTIRCRMQAVEELPPLDQHLEKEHQEKTKVKNIQVSRCPCAPSCSAFASLLGAPSPMCRSAGSLLLAVLYC